MASQTETATRPKVTLHWLEKSRAQRIFWLLEEMNGADYEVKTYKRQATGQAPPELKEIYPLGKSPLVGIEAPGLQKPLILAESALITEYLSEHFAKHLIPKQWIDGKEGQVGGETETWTRYRYFMHYAEGTLMALMVSNLLVTMLRDSDQIPFFIKPVTGLVVGKFEKLFFKPNLAANFALLEEKLSTSPDGGEYLCGNQLTGADILMSYPLTAAKSRNLFETAMHPKLTAYIERIEANEVFKRSIEKAEKITGEKYSVF